MPFKWSEKQPMNYSTIGDVIVGSYDLVQFQEVVVRLQAPLKKTLHFWSCGENHELQKKETM